MCQARKMKQDLSAIIRDFFNFYQIEIKEIKFLFNSSIPTVTLHGQDEDLRGLRNIIQKVSNIDDAQQNEKLDDWVEYVQVHGNHFDSPDILKELNEHLSDKVFFIGFQMSAVDILIYCLLHNVFFNLSFQDKEKYNHLSRWFNLVQHMTNSVLSKSIILFSRCRLYT